MHLFISESSEEVVKVLEQPSLEEIQLENEDEAELDEFLNK